MDLEMTSLAGLAMSTIAQLLFFACSLLALCAAVAAHRLVLHPLAAVPGPRLAAVSSVWYARHARNGSMRSLVPALHARYGPVVRVRPNEVIFNSLAAFRLIYGHGSGLEKSDFYLATALHRPRLGWDLRVRDAPDTLDLLSERDLARYRLQRRLIGPLYQMANLRKFEPAVDAVLGRCVARLAALGGAEVDLKEWMHIAAVECLCAVVLSWSPGYVARAGDDGTSAQSYLGWRRKTVFGLFPLAVLASSVSQTLGRAFGDLWGVTFKTPKHFKPFFKPVHHKCSRRIAAALRDPPAKDTRQDLLADLIQLHRDRPEFCETYLRRMAMSNFGAGHETTCSALTSAMAMIGSHPDVQARVAAEVCPSDSSQLEQGPEAATSTAATPSAPKGPPITIPYDTAARLRYTQASIKEAQRLHPVIGMSLPRRVPKGGGGVGVHVHGLRFPPGTTVGCTPAALHRSADVFGPDAHLFRPDRWLGAPVEVVRAMDACSLAYGGGMRSCPGRHLAELIVYKTVAALVANFDVRVVAMPPAVEMACYFMAMMTGVQARFVPRQ